MKYAKIDSPCGPVTVVVGDLGLREVSFGDPEVRSGWERVDDLPAAVQLTQYFSGVRRCFDVELDPVGTAFQRSVWHALLRIPYGETTTYGAVAKALGRPTASRAVGAANGRNPIAVVIPCHRVIGANGSLTGYAGGLDRKRALLTLERGGSLF